MSEQIEMLKKMVDACAMRHRLLANNIANANTDGFKRQDVDFKAALANAIKSGKPGEISNVQPEVYTDKSSKARANGNNVSIQKEMGSLMDNTMLYKFTTRALSRKFNRLKSVIKGQ